MRFDPDAPDPADPEDLARFLATLFDRVDWGPGETIALRGLGEKGTLGEGAFREQVWVDGCTADVDLVVNEHARRWNKHNAGAFLIPAVMKSTAGELRRQTEADVAAFTSVCVDLDNPDTAEDSLLRLEYALGPAGIVVESSPGKLHAYWLLAEPETDAAHVARLRHLLALKAGGDPSFQRVPQVIRLPGTMHGKNNVRFPVKLRHADTDCRHQLWELEERIEALHPLPWATPEALAKATQGGLNLAAMAGGTWTVKERLATDVHEGGSGPVTRFDAATQVFGHYVHSVRTGAVATVDEARDLARGWMLAHMVPPWPDERFAREWGAVVALDAERHGPLVAPERLYGSGRLDAPGGSAPAGGAPPQGVQHWALRQWVPVDAPEPRRWLVQGLILRGAAHLLASEGGVGKTFALLDLCLGVAAPHMSPDWLGQPIIPDNCGGTAVLLTAEDDADELRIRVHSMDAQGRRFAAEDRCIVIPLVQAGGVFPLVELGPGGVARPSAAWASAMDTLAALPNLQLVAIDTLAATLHGEENSSIVVQQYMTALNLLRAKVPTVATLVTHHVRKQGTKDVPILTASDMRQAIRGSNALLGAVRMAIGIWQPADWRERLKRMGQPEKPGTLFNMAVVKANNPEAMDDTRTLIRAPHGGLMDATHRDRTSTLEEKENAWILCAIERAVEQRKPFSKTGDPGICGGRKSELFAEAADMGRDALDARIEKLKARGAIKTCSMTGKGSGKWLDVAGGVLASLLPGQVFEPDAGALTLDWVGWQFVPSRARVMKVD